MKDTFSKSLNDLIKHNKEGSFSTHSNRSKRLEQAMSQVAEKYIDINSVKNLKAKHIEYLVERWKSEELSTGTIKNRMTDLRWIASKTGKQNIVHRTNDEYGIDRRQYVNNDVNRAKELDLKELDKITDPYTKQSLLLQEAFGLRREEAIKFNPHYADKGDHIRLKDSWTKGGRPRSIPIRNDEQRQLLDKLKEFVNNRGASAMIAPDYNYKQQMKAYTYQTTQCANIRGNHGLRHKYAQDRYREITGNECPKNGGKLARNMTLDERAIDTDARLTISSELGHSREAITNVYLGGKL